MKLKPFYFSTQILIIFMVILFGDSIAQTDNSWKLYDDTEVALVEITVDPAALEWLYQNPQSDSMFVCSVHFKNLLVDKIVDSVGFGLRGNTSREAQKKSFQLSFNEFIKGQQLSDVDVLNLNAEHNDPSIIRSKLCWDFYNKIGMISSRAAHSEVYINGQYYGLYISVEHIDEEFLKHKFSDPDGNLWKCLYPADLVYLGSDPNLYKFSDGNRRTYDLKTNESEDDYFQLARLINIINNTPENLFADSLEKIIDVSDVLKYFAVNILTGSWDDYWSLMNNYYLYHSPSENKFHLIPFDYDNTFGVDWLDIDWANVNPYDFPKIVNSDRPLAERMMNNFQYKNLYTHFLQFYRDNVYELPLWENRIDEIKDMITPSALADTFKGKDYGFTPNDFFDSYSATGYSNQHVKRGLKEYVNLRNSSLNSFLFFVNAPPIIYSIDFTPTIPLPNQSIEVNASGFSNAGISSMIIKYYPQDQANSIDYAMTFNPVAGTMLVEESDRWSGTIPALGENGFGSFQIFVTDQNSVSQTYPRHGKIHIQTPEILSDNIVINELLAKNDSIIPDQDGEYDDWIEIYNPTNEQITLTGKYLTDDPDSLMKWQFPSALIPSHSFLLIWADNDLAQQGFHTNFALNADGEFLALVAEDGVTVIDSISFGSQSADLSFGRFPDASVAWTFLQPTPQSSNLLTEVKNELIIVPSEFSIQAFPNPFNPEVTIEYSLPTGIENNFQERKVSIKIFDILGNQVAEFLNSTQSAGRHRILWNAKNNSGDIISTGIYIISINTGESLKSVKVLFLK